MSTSWARRVAEAIGEPGDVRPLGGGAAAFTAGGRRLVAKTGEGVLDEADGLRALAGVPGAPPVPEVVLAGDGLLVTAYVEQAARGAAHEERLGRSLARLHLAPWPQFGGGSRFIGACRVDPEPAGDAASFYARRLTELAARCGLEAEVCRATSRLEELLGPVRPSLVHGDLWWGNVLWGADGEGWLIDPSVHGGHPEEDLAMLGLFGPVPERLLAAYAELRPLDEHTSARLPLFELVPLLVHAVLFGEPYRSRAATTLRRLA